MPEKDWNLEPVSMFKKKKNDLGKVGTKGGEVSLVSHAKVQMLLSWFNILQYHLNCVFARKIVCECWNDVGETDIHGRCWILPAITSCYTLLLKEPQSSSTCWYHFPQVFLLLQVLIKVHGKFIVSMFPLISLCWRKWCRVSNACRVQMPRLALEKTGYGILRFFT